MVLPGGSARLHKMGLPPYKLADDLPPLLDHWSEVGYRVPRYLSDEQTARLMANPEYMRATNGGLRCPVCLNERSYKYLGETYSCDDDAYGHIIMRLVQLYYLHNIPLQYQQLVWEEWPTDTEWQKNAQDQILEYINLFPRYSLNGVGLTFYSKGTATGKTWGATSVLKELVKRGYDGWFAPWYRVKSYYEDVNNRYLVSRVQDAQLLVLDDVTPPWTEKQKNFFADKLEELLRPRTDANLPTIITTNLLPNEMEQYYPRIFSLMSAKNHEIELDGADARLDAFVMRRNAEIEANDEALPIT